jgi:cytochrome P450
LPDQHRGGESDIIAITLYNILQSKALTTNKQEAAKELDTAAEGRISKPVTFNEAWCLPCIQTVIKEGLRLHSAVGLGLQCVVLPNGAILAGREFPGGAIVGVNAWIAQKSIQVYAKIQINGDLNVGLELGGRDEEEIWRRILLHLVWGVAHV